MGFGKDGKGAMIRETITDGALGALAGQDVVAFQGPVITEDFRILKSEIYAIVNVLTAGQGNGLLFGIANGELTAAEIEECLEAQGPLDLNDRVPTEKAERNVKWLGTTDNVLNATERLIENPEGGTILTSKHRWTYSNPEGWKYWLYNRGGTLTTGATLQLMATHYGVWLV